MPSQWYCFTDDEAGPYTFRELAVLIAQGELRPTDLVRRAETQTWQQVDAVFGLLRAAGEMQQQTASRFARQSGGVIGSQLIAVCERLLPQGPGERLIGGLSLLLILACLGELTWLRRQRPSRFPRAPRMGLVMQVPSRLHQLRPPTPAVPTVPGLPLHEPVSVPGFERTSWLKSPTLSADLLTIVYAGFAGPQQLDDLIIAQRTNVAQPFENHRPVYAVNSPAREAHPTLSPDGLELIFTRLGQPATLWHSRRPHLQAEFTTAKPLNLLNDPAPEQHHDAPQFLDAKTIRVTLGDQEFQDRTQWYATREGSGAFRLTTPVPIQNRWPRYYFTQRGRRAYLPTEAGIKVTALSPRSRLFEEPEVLLGPEIVGPKLTANDDTIWVSPAEDIIFYCGPGTNPADQNSFRLWMVRF